jgi:capsular polysaccharide biosynthesis protein
MNFYHLLIIIKKRIIFLVLITIIIFAIGVSYAFFSQPIFTVSNVIVAPQASSQGTLYAFQFGNIINVTEIKSLLKNFNEPYSAYERISEVVGSSDAKNIVKVKSTLIRDSNLLLIDVDTKDKESGRKFVEKLPEYIISRNFTAKRISDQEQIIKKNIEDLKSFIENPLLKMKISKGTIIVDPLTFKNLFEQYNNYIISLERLEKGDFVALAGKTLLPDRPSKPHKLLISALSLLMGLIISLILIFIAEAFSKENFENTQK